MGKGTSHGLFQGTKGSKITKHGAQRMKERGFTTSDIADTKNTSMIKRQADGAIVYVKEVSPGKFNIIVEGSNGPITMLKHVSKKSLDRLSKNYKWK